MGRELSTLQIVSNNLDRAAKACKTLSIYDDVLRNALRIQGLKLSIIPAISTGCNLEGLLQAPSNTLPRRFAYAAASDASLDSANRIKDP